MVAQLPAESRYELRGFHLIEISSPKPKHQRIVTNVYDLLKPYVKANNSGKVFVSPLDVVFQKGDRPAQFDICGQCKPPNYWR